jgi:hypothetical protein
MSPASSLAPHLGAIGAVNAGDTNIFAAPLLDPALDHSDRVVNGN